VGQRSLIGSHVSRQVWITGWVVDSPHFASYSTRKHKFDSFHESRFASSRALLNTSLYSTMTTSNPTAAEKPEKDSSYGASCTSYYTTEEKKDAYETLEDILNSKCSDPLVKQVIKDLMKVCADITEALRVALVTVEGSTNDFGDSLLSVDVSCCSCFVFGRYFGL
jgi:hypothetical protein